MTKFTTKLLLVPNAELSGRLEGGPVEPACWRNELERFVIPFFAYGENPQSFRVPFLHSTAPYKGHCAL